MMRGSPAPWILPNAPLFNDDTGVFRFTQFSTLNASPRNCSVWFSATLKVRVSPISNWNTPGPFILFAPRVPYVPVAGGANALTRIHWSADCVAGYGLATIFGR